MSFQTDSDGLSSFGYLFAVSRKQPETAGRDARPTWLFYIANRKAAYNRPSENLAMGFQTA
ncbi:TPA: hypothetical protein ACFP4Q_000493 [Neisseria weaveri]